MNIKSTTRSVSLPVLAIAAVLVVMLSGSAIAGGIITGGGGSNGPTGNLTVSTQVVNNYGGTATPSSFITYVKYLNGTNVTGSPFSGSSAGVLFSNLVNGTYVVSEAPVSGYSESLSGSCASNGQITISGGSSTCTFTNSDQPAQLTVITVVNDNYGGTAVSNSFTMSVSGSSPSPSSFSGSSAGTTVTLSAGAYSVSESAISGYSAAYSSGCSGTLSVGQTATCTVTVSDTPAHITVVEDVVGGTLSANAFTILVAGSSPSPSSFLGSASGTQVTINQGNYSISENQIVLYNASTNSRGCQFGHYDNQGRWWWVSPTSSKSGWGLNFTKFGWNDGTNAFNKNAPAYSWTGSTLNKIYAYYAINYSAGCYGFISVGQSATCTITSTFTIPQRLSVQMYSNVTQVIIGNSVGFTANIIGGVAPYSYTIYVQNSTTRNRYVATGQSGTSSSGNLTFTETPVTLGDYFYEINVTDSIGLKASANSHILVSQPVTRGQGGHGGQDGGGCGH